MDVGREVEGGRKRHCLKALQVYLEGLPSLPPSLPPSLVS